MTSPPPKDAREITPQRIATMRTAVREGRSPLPPAVGDLLDEVERLRSQLDEARRQNEKLREFVAFCMREGSWMGGDIDGGDAQDKAEELGLIVEVPADQEFRDEYDSDTMLVLAWRTPSQSAATAEESKS